MGPGWIDCGEDGEVVTEVTPGMVLRAFRRVPLPTPELHVQPPGGETLVNLDTIFSTEAERFTEVVRLLGKRITLDITPSTFTWDHGDGTTQTTDTPGRPWKKNQPVGANGLITHLYQSKGAVQPTVTITWTARWKQGNRPWQPVNGTVTMTSPPVPLDVLEAEPQLVQ